MTVPTAKAQSGPVARLAFGNVSGTLASGAVTLVMVGAANVLIGRMLGVEGQGRVAAATLIPMIAAYAGEIGLPVSVAYFVNARSDERQAVIATGRTIAISLGIALMAAAVLGISVLDFEFGVRGIAYLFTLFVLLNLLYRVHLSILQADFRMRAYNVVRISGAAVYLIILAAYWTLDAGSELRVVAALLIANAVWCITATRLTYSRPAFSYQPALAKALLSFGGRAHVGNVSSVDALRLDQLVLALFLGPRELGLYVAAMTIITGNRVIGTSVGALCFPLASASRRDGTEDEAWSQFRSMLLLAILLSVGVALAELILGGRLLAALFGSDFSEAGTVLQVLAVGSIFMNVRQVCADWLRGWGCPTIVTLSELAGIVALVILASVLWNGSVQAVAWAMSAAAVVALAWILTGVYRLRLGSPMGRGGAGGTCR